MSNVGGTQDITVTVGTGGLTIGTGGNVTGADNGDRITNGGNITLNNISGPKSHGDGSTTLHLKNTPSAGLAKLPILRVNQNNQSIIGVLRN